MKAWRKENKAYIKKKSAEWYRQNKRYVKLYQKKNKRKIEKTLAKRKRKHPNWFLLCWAKQRAKKLGVPFNLIASDIVVPKRCPVFGFILKPGKRGNSTSPSVDRFKPSRGYVKGNIAVISRRANLLKNDATLLELKKLIAWMEKNS